MMIKIHETKKFILYREKTEKRDVLIMENKKTGARSFMNTKTFIETAEMCFDEVKKYD